MYKINFTENELAIIYESVEHMAKVRDVYEKNNKLGELSRNIMGKISNQSPGVTSAFYVSDNLIED